jgi:hypothetical protein
MKFTFEIYKKDARCKDGEKLVKKFDTDLFTTKDAADIFAKQEFVRDGFRVEIHETMVERINIMSGKPFMERYDTPYYCSPSSETYWSM